MLNAVGREIPQEVLDETGKTVFQGSYQFDQHEYIKTAVNLHKYYSSVLIYKI